MAGRPGEYIGGCGLDPETGQPHIYPHGIPRERGREEASKSGRANELISDSGQGNRSSGFPSSVTDHYVTQGKRPLVHTSDYMHLHITCCRRSKTSTQSLPLSHKRQILGKAKLSTVTSASIRPGATHGEYPVSGGGCEGSILGVDPAGGRSLRGAEYQSRQAARLDGNSGLAVPTGGAYSTSDRMAVGM